jgi:raffinose/stachyose/melibiose transport system permease protein
MQLLRQVCRVKRYWFLLPALVIYGVFMIYPMLHSVAISLHEWNGLAPDMTFVGLQNYVDFFQDPVSYRVLKNNVVWISFSLIFPVTLGLLLAVAVNQNIRGKTLFRSIFYSPAVLPMISVGIIWAWIYNPMFGALNAALRDLGLHSWTRGWLADPKTALYAVIATGIWKGTGFPMILFLAGLQDIPQELYESAQIDGAARFQVFRHITIPLLRETFIIVISLVVVDSLKVFDLVYSMTWGGPGRATQVLATWMYFNTFMYNKAGYGSAIAWVMTAISLIIVFPYIKVMSRR